MEEVELISNSSTSGPKFIYGCTYSTGALLRTDLLTNEQSCYQIPGYCFNAYCRWNELPGRNLLVTGGASGQVVKIMTLRELQFPLYLPCTPAECCMQRCITLSTSDYWEGSLMATA
jgi:hypothetical protein